MTPNEVGKNLHDRATRGYTISPDEQRQLEAWYSRLDEEEGRALGLVSASPDLADLRKRVNLTLQGIVSVSKTIQEVQNENTALRREIVELQRRLAPKAS
jgi:hypothetical protein